MSEKTSVATPTSTGMVNNRRRKRYLCIQMKPLHEFRETLTAQAERGGSSTAMSGRARERRTYETLLEFEPRPLQRLVCGDLGRARDRGGQIGGANKAPLRHRDDERREDILQLSNVPRPIIP